MSPALESDKPAVMTNSCLHFLSHRESTSSLPVVCFSGTMRRAEVHVPPFCKVPLLASMLVLWTSWKCCILECPKNRARSAGVGAHVLGRYLGRQFPGTFRWPQAGCHLVPTVYSSVAFKSCVRNHPGSHCVYLGPDFSHHSLNKSLQVVSALNISSTPGHLPLCCSSHVLKIRFHCIPILRKTPCWLLKAYQ